MTTPTTMARQGQGPTHVHGARLTARALAVLLWAIGSAYLVKIELAAQHPDWVLIASLPPLWAAVIALPVLAHHALAEARYGAALALAVAAAIGLAYTLTGTIGRQAEVRDARAATAAETALQRSEIEAEIATARARLAAARARCDAGNTCLPATRALVVEREWDLQVQTSRRAKLDPTDPLALERRVAAAIGLYTGRPADEHLPAVGLILPALLGLLLDAAAFACALYGWPCSHSLRAASGLRAERNRPAARHATDTAGQSDYPAVDADEAARMLAFLANDRPGPSGGWSMPAAPPAPRKPNNPAVPDGPGSSGTREAVLERILADHSARRQAASQRELSERYGVPRSTLSDWMADWERSGLVTRRTVGRCKVLAE